ncbi:MAG: ABC transporter ATP-binding protein [Clostridiales bacterium]|nr:ABC transporter ATP-binding protein [Clostridiales bacterium]
MENSILRLENITKVYSNGVVANKDISVNFQKGEIHSIVGENGAGKSTLMKILFGIEQPSAGKLYLRGEERRFHNSLEAIDAGIGMVHQHFMLIPSFTVAQSIVLGMEPRKNRVFLNKKAAVEQTRAIAEQYNFDIDVTKKISELSVGAKQKVEILKTLYRNAEIIILDEPTSVLTPQETEILFDELEKFRKLGHTILFISHKLGEVKQISDRITIMRNGESRGTFNNAEISMEELTARIIGRELISSYDEKKRDWPEKTPVLTVEGLCLAHKGQTRLEGISFAVKRGEIFGIAGVQGNGQDELIRAVAGLSGHTAGAIALDGTDISKLSIKKRREAGLAYVPEDRMLDGTAGEASLGDNIISTYFERKSLNGPLFMRGRRINAEARRLIKEFSIKAESPAQKIQSLSGGNIQKVVVAREHNTNPKCLLAEQPTHGIDIGSAEFIHLRLIEMRNAGAGLLLVSADLDEVMSLSDRLIVMYEGRIAAYFSGTKGLTRSELGYYMLGVKRQTPEEIGGALRD